MSDTSSIWDARFMALALEARSWVKGPDLGVGACIVSPDRRNFSLGYSGLPRGIRDTTERITCQDYKDHNLVHAELNAILNASQSVVGWTLYSTTHPCAHCAAAIIQAGIIRVVSPMPQKTGRWVQHHLEAAELMREAHIVLERIDA